MTPFEQAIAGHLEGCSAAEFYRDLDAHFLNGIVIATPSVFLMLRKVFSGASEELITDPTVSFREEECDAWFVYLAAGSLPDLFRLGIEPMEKICYLRFGKLKINRFQSILKQSQNGQTTQTTQTTQGSRSTSSSRAPSAASSGSVSITVAGPGCRLSSTAGTDAGPDCSGQ